jgi:hypothetical protein
MSLSQWYAAPLITPDPAATSSPVDNRLKQYPWPARCVDRVIPDPMNLRVGDQPRHASEQVRKLGREEKQLGRKRKLTACSRYMRWTFGMLRTTQSK